MHAYSKQHYILNKDMHVFKDMSKLTRVPVGEEGQGGWKLKRGLERRHKIKSEKGLATLHRPVMITCYHLINPRPIQGEE